MKMSGQNELTVSSSWEKINTAVQQYLDSIGVNKIKYNNEVEQILSYTLDELKKLTPLELEESAYVLAQYALFIQKEFNTHYAKHEWARRNLDNYIGTRAKEYGDKFTKFEEKRGAIIKDSPVAGALDKMIKEASIRVNSLEQISVRINAIARILENISGKRKYDNTEQTSRRTNSSW